MSRREAAVALALLAAGALGLLAVFRGMSGVPPAEVASTMTVRPRDGEDVPDDEGFAGEAPSQEEGQGEKGASGPSEGGAVRFDGSVEEVSSRLIEEREGAGDCILARAGYLDFTGRVWGCVFQGNRWVEICLVEEDGGGEECSVRVWRMDADDAARSLGV